MDTCCRRVRRACFGGARPNAAHELPFGPKSTPPTSFRSGVGGLGVQLPVGVFGGSEHVSARRAHGAASGPHAVHRAHPPVEKPVDCSHSAPMAMQRIRFRNVFALDRVKSGTRGRSDMLRNVPTAANVEKIIEAG